EHRAPDAVEPDLDLLPRDRSARGGAARDRGGDRARPERVRAGRAVAAECLHPAAPAPDGRTGEPRLPIARPRAAPAGPAPPRRGPLGLAMGATAAAGERPAPAGAHPAPGRGRAVVPRDP